MRGNVVSAPALRKDFRAGLPRVLVVSPYLPFPLSHGGAVRIYNLCRALANEVDFVLACFREANETVCYPELHEVFREVHVVDIDEKYPDAFVPRQVAEYRNSAMSELIRSKCLSGEIDIVQLEYTQMAEYADHTGAVPLILVEHDITFTLHEQLARTLGTPGALQQYELWRSFERSALQCSNAVWTMSEHDRAIAVEHGAPRRSTSVVPNGVDLRRFTPERRETAGHSLLFVGSFRHLPNLLAFEALREIIMPEVWKVLPDVTLNVIAGPSHERAVDAAKKRRLLDPDPRIQIQGFVDDVRPAYRECDVAVIPLPVSAGTNIKLMEAMACGRAVVSTPVGCQGLGLQDESDLLIREADAGFAEAIIRLLTDEVLRTRIADIARQTAELRFGWDYIASAALETYDALRSGAAPVRDTPGEELYSSRAISPTRKSRVSTPDA
jgi:glycosyltransferase involved in cell wall biosynthesis